MMRRERVIRETWDNYRTVFDFSVMPVWKAAFPCHIEPTPYANSDVPSHAMDILEFRHERHYSADRQSVRDRIICEDIVLVEDIHGR